VFLGGLLKPLVEIEVGMNPDAVQYEFWDGVRDLLVDSVATSDAVSVLEAVSSFVAERLGLSVDAFMAVLRHPVQAEDQGLVSQARPFARVTAQVLRKLGGEYAVFAEELERSSQVNASTESPEHGIRIEQDFDSEVEIAEVPDRFLLWEQASTKIYTLQTDSPWSALPFNALVVPVGARGELGSFGRNFEEFFSESGLGDDFLRQRIYGTIRESNQTLITPQQPLLIQVGSTIPELVSFARFPNEQSPYPPDFILTDDPDIQRFIICVTVNSRQDISIQNIAVAMEAILRLAEEHRLERVILPLPGAGDVGLPVDQVATVMLNVVYSSRFSRIREITFVGRDVSTIEAIKASQLLTVESILRIEIGNKVSDLEQLEQAIAIHQQALQIYTREAFPQEWAMMQNRLATAYCNRIRGERADNLEQAIAAYQLALQVYTREAFPQDWATIQNNLATVYSDRIRGERADNLEQAIAAYQLALQVYTREAFPQDWATIQNNLSSQIGSLPAEKTIEVFFSYSREDRPLRDQLEKHLSSLKRQGVIRTWHDRQIAPGAEWEQEIGNQLKTADIILLLVSPAFVSSKYCNEIELPEAIARHDAGEACVVPILLRPVAGWQDLPFAKLQVCPSGGKPVTVWNDPDNAYIDIVNGIRSAINQLLEKRQQQVKAFELWLATIELPLTPADLSQLPQWQKRTGLTNEMITAKLEAAQIERQQQARRFAEAEQQRMMEEELRQAVQRQRAEAEHDRLSQERLTSQAHPKSFPIYVTKRKLFGSGDQIPIEMIDVPGGRFWMGALDMEGQSNENPRHEVAIAPFYISKYLITQIQYQTVVGKNPSHFKGKNRPVENVSWWDAVYFCEALSKKTNRRFTLPSEAQWEYACRAGTMTSFYFGETISTNQANYNGNTDDSVGEGMYRAQTTNVGVFSPNNFGLYDMHGNVWEWCADHWHNSYDGAPNDGSSWLTDDNRTSRLLRGGSWLRGSDRCRSASRYRFSPNAKDNSIGFRVICV
jgi:formylglycine-generating enzyme required for sulfatase activity/tetratricopeptide (TPR) repeat protein